MKLFGFHRSSARSEMPDTVFADLVAQVAVPTLNAASTACDAEAAVPMAAQCSATKLPRQLFNEQAYIESNPDVADAVAAGVTTAYRHYVAHGFDEERRGQRQRNLPKASESLTLRDHEDGAVLERLVDLEIEKRTLLEAWDRQLAGVGPVSFDMLSEEVDEELVPPLDRSPCDEAALDHDQRFWRDQGYVIKRGFIPEALIDRYCEIRRRHPDPGGWSCLVPYMHVPELRDVSLYPPLMALLEKLIGEELGLHLNLTGWVSTERNWHQDDYLNPPYVNSWYAAVWVALDDIHPDSGPFEFVPGSHKWPLLKGHKVRLYLSAEERRSDSWPSIAERFVNDAAAAEIERSGIAPKQFIAKKGDVLVWHGRLMHRGSYPNVPGMPRLTLISHYSGISHRLDMPLVDRDQNGCAYFRHLLPLDFDPYREATTAA